MKKNYFYLCILFLMSFLLNAQPGANDNTFNITVGEFFNSGANDNVITSVIQSDGKIIIGGSFTNYNGIPINRIARLNTDGSLDTTFNTGSGANIHVSTSAVQPDGKIIIGGFFTSFNGSSINRIARLNSDGSLDTTFNTGSGANNTVWNTAVQPDDKIIVVGEFISFNGTTRNRIARLNPDGSVDTTFNTGSGANNIIYTTVVQPDGKIIIGGDFTSFNGTSKNRIARLNTDGSLDTTFNPGSETNSIIYTAAVQPDGKIIIGGFFTSLNGIIRNYIARLNPDGSLDTTFNPSSGAYSVIYTTAVQPDGKIIIGGNFTNFNGSTRICIARLNSDGSLDTTFNPGSGANNTVRTTAVQLDGKIIIGGDFTQYNGITRNRIARLLNAITPVPDSNGILYVKKNSSGNGSSWNDALGDLAEALSAAENNPTITQIWVAQGSYESVGTGLKMRNNLTILGGFPSNGNPNLSDRNWNIYPTVITGNGVRRVFNNGFFNAEALNNTAILDGFTIQNGYNNVSGAGMYLFNASPIFRNLVFENNLLASGGNGGGAIFCRESSPVISNVIFRNNSAANGAGMFNFNANPTLENVTFENNLASNSGGGLYNFNSSPVVSNADFAFNEAGSGGGIYNNGGNPTYFNVTIHNNISNGFNGAGAGIYNQSSNASFTNALIYKNTSQGNTSSYGGGISSHDTTLNLTNVTLADNTASVGSTCYNFYSTVVVKNSILKGTYFNDTQSNMSFSNSNFSWDVFTTNVTLVTSNIVNQDPLFVNPTENDYSLTSSSPLLDAGRNTFFENLTNSSIDILGNPRVFNLNQFGIIDMGAIEYQGLCDGALTFFKDNDNDGYGTDNESVLACTQPVGYAALSGDCNDNNPAVNPGATEVCWNGIDDDCDGLQSEGCSPVVVNMATANNTTLPSFAIAVSAQPYSYAGST
ncbi:hypothetical protein H9X54_001870, partial [Flavobacterium macrobrachii]